MLLNAISPSIYTFNILIDYYCSEGRVKEATAYVSLMVKHNIPLTVVTFTALMKGYFKVDDVNTVFELFRIMENFGVCRDAAIYSTVLTELFERDMFREALAMWSGMKLTHKFTDITIYNNIVNGYCKFGEVSKAKDVIAEMEGRGLHPNASSFNPILEFLFVKRGLVEKGEVEEALAFFNYVIETKIKRDVVTNNIIVEGLCKCGKVVAAIDFFVSLSYVNVNVITFTSMMRGLFGINSTREVLMLFYKMKQIGIKVDYVLFETIISGFFCKGDYESGRRIRCVMLEDKQLKFAVSKRGSRFY